MKKISDKNKSLILFLLAIILIIGAWYFYKSFDTEGEILGAGMVRKMKLIQIKNLIEENATNFITEDTFEELYKTQQYQDLTEVNTFLNLNTGVGNSNPFYNPNVVVE